VEVLSDGSSVPERPLAVPTHAAWFAQEKQWCFGRIANDDPNSRIGLWQWWSPQGVLLAERLYNEEQRELEERKYHDNGVLFVERKKDRAGNSLYTAYFFADGSPNSETVKVFKGSEIVEHAVRKRGRLLHRGTVVGARMSYEFFGDDDRVTATGATKDGEPVGTWTFYDEAGKPTHVLNLDSSHLGSYDLDDDFQPDWILGRMLLADAMNAPRPSELVGVDEIRWQEVSGCYSEEVENFPKLLVALTSNEPAVRAAALGRIESETLHQGSVYEATALVLPFLVKLLDHPRADRAALLQFAYHVGCSASAYVEWARESLEEGEDEESDARAVVETYGAVCAGWPSFRRFLSDASDNVREVATLLAAFAARADAREALGAIARQDASTRIRAIALQSLLALDGAESREAEPFLDQPDGLIRMVAAVAAGNRFGPAAPAKAVDVLLNCFETPDAATHKAYNALPFVGDEALADIVLALGCIRNERARAQLSALAKRIDEMSELTAITYGRGLLALALGDGERPYAADFVTALEAIAQSRKFYGFVNCNDVLDAWNLPRGSEALSAFVREVKAASDPEAAMHRKMTGQ
jgi:hypothetical protein